MAQRVAIIGGGIGGLAAAVRLQSAGFDVTVFEKNDRVGGKLASRITSGGYVDLGPTLLTMIPVFEDLFSSAGADFHRAVPLRRIDPSCRYHWSDGTVFDAAGERAGVLESAADVFPEDVDNLDRFLNEVAELYEATRGVFLERPFRGIRELFTPTNLRLLPLLGRLGFTSTMYRSLSSRFRNPKLIQLLCRFATYNGSSPYTAPATLNVIAHVEMTMGAWYPVGGMQALADAVADLAASIGVRIETGAEVTGVERDPARGRVTGLVVNGARESVDIVISNVDALQTWNALLEPAGIPAPRRLRSEVRSCSGFLVTGSVSKRPIAAGESDRTRAHHSIYFVDDYRTEFRDIFEREVFPDPMTIYRSIPSVSDPSLSIGDREAWYLLVNVPQGRTPEHPERYAGSVLDRLRRFESVPEMEDMEWLGPDDFEQRYGSVGGAIYGASSNSIFSAFLRHGNRHRALENFYFVGGSVHPGGGLPLVALSGRIVSSMIIDRYGAGSSRAGRSS